MFSSCSPKFPPTRPSAAVIAFPVPRRPNRLGVRERIETLEWATVASPSGYPRVDICDDDPDPDIGDFVLVYEPEREWASWGVSRDGAHFTVWRTSQQGVLDRFDTLREALDAILTQPRRRGRGRKRALPIE